MEVLREGHDRRIDGGFKPRCAFASLVTNRPLSTRVSDIIHKAQLSLIVLLISLEKKVSTELS
jgi:hypothetical protein